MNQANYQKIYGKKAKKNAYLVRLQSPSHQSVQKVSRDMMEDGAVLAVTQNTSLISLFHSVAQSLNKTMMILVLVSILLAIVRFSSSRSHTLYLSRNHPFISCWDRIGPGRRLLSPSLLDCHDSPRCHSLLSTSSSWCLSLSYCWCHSDPSYSRNLGQSPSTQGRHAGGFEIC